MLVPLRHRGRANGDQPLPADENPSDEAHVTPSGLQPLREHGAAGGDPPLPRSPIAILQRGAYGHEDRSPGAVAPEESRPQHGTLVPRQIRPAVLIDVRLPLPVHTPHEGVSPAITQLVRQPDNTH